MIALLLLVTLFCLLIYIFTKYSPARVEAPKNKRIRSSSSSNNISHVSIAVPLPTDKYTSLREDVDSLTTRFGECEIRTQGFQEWLATRDQGFKKMEERNITRDRDIEELRTGIEELRAQNVALGERVATLEKEKKEVLDKLIYLTNNASILERLNTDIVR